MGSVSVVLGCGRKCPINVASSTDNSRYEWRRFVAFGRMGCNGLLWVAGWTVMTKEPFRVVVGRRVGRDCRAGEGEVVCEIATVDCGDASEIESRSY